MENHHFQWINPLFLWPFSIALNYQRVPQRIDKAPDSVAEIFSRHFFLRAQSSKHPVSICKSSNNHGWKPKQGHTTQWPFEMWAVSNFCSWQGPCNVNWCGLVYTALINSVGSSLISTGLQLMYRSILLKWLDFEATHHFARIIHLLQWGSPKIEDLLGVIHIVNDREAHDNPGCSLSLQQAFFRSGTRLETTCGILETNRETPQVFFGGYEYGISNNTK